MRYLLDTNALLYFLEDVVRGFQGIEDGDEVHFSLPELNYFVETLMKRRSLL